MHGWIPPQRFFAYLSWQEVDSLPDKKNTVIIQPLGAIEQHGYHLPLVVDAAISQGVLGKALSLLPSEIPAFALPTLYYGKSNEHDGFPGTISISSQTLSSLLMEVGESIYKAGFRKWIMFNSHGGQPQILEIVARELHQLYPDFAIFPFFSWRVATVTNELLTPKEREWGIHAGDAETSLMLALLPEWVKMELAVREYPPVFSDLLSLEGKFPFAWLTREISKSGVIGDATAASREKGEKILSDLATGWVRVITEVYHFNPGNC
ncbi:MAG TPA: creatininase family protein [Geminocystis sp. M7585_C2015_104]|nr:creatininase family protein [Geminocystis sp. M7585_C2015_104]